MNRYPVNKETVALNETLDQMDSWICIVNSNAAEYTFFSSPHRTFSGIDHLLAHKTSLSAFKKMEIISCIFSNHSGMKLQINYEKKAGKLTNM